jgi:hypothetical protein
MEYFGNADEGLTDYNFVVSTLGPPTLLKIQANSKHKLTPADLGIIAPSKDDWIELAVEPSLGFILLAENGNSFTTSQLGELMNGNIIFQSGPLGGKDEMEFTIYYAYDDNKQEWLEVSLEITSIVNAYFRGTYRQMFRRP